MQKQNFEFIRIIAERRERRFNARDVTVMVGAPDVDHLRETAFVLVAVVRDIGGEIRADAVGANDDTVFVIAVCSGVQPQRAFFFIQLAARFQFGASRLDRFRMQRAFTEPLIKFHMEIRQIFA